MRLAVLLSLGLCGHDLVVAQALQELERFDALSLAQKRLAFLCHQPTLVLHQPVSPTIVIFGEVESPLVDYAVLVGIARHLLGERPKIGPGPVGSGDGHAGFGKELLVEEHHFAGDIARHSVVAAFHRKGVNNHRIKLRHFGLVVGLNVAVEFHDGALLSENRYLIHRYHHDIGKIRAAGDHHKHLIGVFGADPDVFQLQIGVEFVEFRLQVDERTRVCEVPPRDDLHLGARGLGRRGNTDGQNNQRCQTDQSYPAVVALHLY